MDMHYQKEYTDLYSNHWWFRSREKFILSVLDTIQHESDLRILDIGCGPGILLTKLNKYGTAEAIEPKESYFTYGDDIKSQIHRLTFPTESHVLKSEQYDVILLLDVLEHIENESLIIHEVKRLLKIGGKLIITVPAFMSLWGPHDIVNHHLRRYTLPYITDHVLKSGLRYVWGSYFFGWCFIPLWIVRRVKRITQRKNPHHDFIIPPAWLNKALQSLSYVEFTFARKWRLPFGTSLMLIAEKHE